MKKFLGNLICASILMSTSPAFSDGHLDRTVKFQDGERYANCVYGEGGIAKLRRLVDGDLGKQHVVEYEKECGSGWEGRFLYQARFSEFGSPDQVWDLERAYNCCVHDSDGRSEICAKQHGERAWAYSWGDCADYLGTLLGNVANVLPVIQQPQANEAVKMACIRAISGRGDFNNGEDWLFNTDYYNRDDKLFDDCFKKEEYLSKAVPYTFDYLRDYTACLWNKPDDPFCSGSRRRFPGTVDGWEKDR